MNLPSLGAAKNDLDTPALCVDLDVLEANIAAMAAACRAKGVDWRPHSKCYKSPVIGKKLLEAGAIGLTCAKLGEAEVMAAGGITDLLIANQIAGPQKMQRLVELRRQADPIVCVDHPDHIRQIGAALHEAGLTVRVLIEVDIGLHRAGAAPGEASLALARQIAATPGLEMAGVMGYEGHLLRIEDPQQKAEQIHAALDLLVATRDAIVAAGLPCPIVSCGGTGSYLYTLEHPGITEIQAGGAIMMDVFYRRQCGVTQFNNALTVVTTVVSRPAPDRAIVDAGRKTMNMELNLPEALSHQGVEVKSLSAEHGALALAPEAQDLRIGDRVEFIPGYSDFTCVLHDRFYGIRQGRLEEIIPLAGRGRLQ